ncbi:MAG: DUF2516 family protein [Sporichthyaceae bacterium]
MGYDTLDSAMNLMGAGLLAVHVFALLDVSLRSAAAFPAADKQTKQMWLILLGVAVAWGALPALLTQRLVFRSVFDLLVIAGTVAALVYLLDARPAVRAQGGGRGGSRGGRGGRGPKSPRGW